MIKRLSACSREIWMVNCVCLWNKVSKRRGLKRWMQDIPPKLPNSGSVFTFWEVYRHNLRKKRACRLGNPLIFCPFSYRGLFWSLKWSANSICREAKLRSNGSNQVKMGIGKSSIRIILTLVFCQGLWVPRVYIWGKKQLDFMGFGSQQARCKTA